MARLPDRAPVIGVTTSRRGGNIMWLCHRFQLWRVGARAVRLRPADTPPDFSQFDGLIIGGGDDISANLYGGNLEMTVRVDPERDRLELSAMRYALAHDLPTLGVCRGAQMINIALGGTLFGDIYEAFDGLPRIRTPLPRKWVSLANESHLHGILLMDRLRVNSLHHQSIDRLGEGLHAVAFDDFGIIQAIEHRTRRFLFGVQWHPEFLVMQKDQVNLFRTLVARSVEARRDRPRARAA